MDLLGTKPISFNPDLARVLGSAKAGLLLSQLLYWHEKGNDPEWIYKTIKEMEEETALSEDEQNTAIKICEKFEVLEKKVKGIPAKRHFRIDIDKIIDLLKSSSLKNKGQVSQKTENKFLENGETNTENTTKNTNKEYLAYKKKLKNHFQIKKS